MRHLVIGAGGVGGLLAAALARAGAGVTLQVRPGTAGSYPQRLLVESRVLGDFEVEVPIVEHPGEEADVAWVTVKATQLEQVLGEPLRARAVIPLLNGIDHLARLRELYGDKVLAGTISVESERVAPGHIVQPGPFIRVELAPTSAEPGSAALLSPEQVAEDVTRAGIVCRVRDSAGAVLWGKLAMLAPAALATTGAQAPMGAVRDDPQLCALLLDCMQEVVTVAAAEGVELDADSIRSTLMSVPPGMRTSMQKDLAAGHALEADAIGGPVIRHGRAHGVATPATAALMDRVQQALPNP